MACLEYIGNIEGVRNNKSLCRLDLPSDEAVQIGRNNLCRYPFLAFCSILQEGDQAKTALSRKHASILIEGGQYLVQENDTDGKPTTNGTFHKSGRHGRLVRLRAGEKVPLVDGDEMIFGGNSQILPGSPERPDREVLRAFAYRFRLLPSSRPAPSPSTAGSTVPFGSVPVAQGPAGGPVRARHTTGAAVSTFIATSTVQPSVDTVHGDDADGGGELGLQVCGSLRRGEAGKVEKHEAVERVEARMPLPLQERGEGGSEGNINLSLGKRSASTPAALALSKKARTGAGGVAATGTPEHAHAHEEGKGEGSAEPVRPSQGPVVASPILHVSQAGNHASPADTVQTLGGIRQVLGVTSAVADMIDQRHEGAPGHAQIHAPVDQCREGASHDESCNGRGTWGQSSAHASMRAGVGAMSSPRPFDETQANVSMAGPSLSMKIDAAAAAAVCDATSYLAFARGVLTCVTCSGLAVDPVACNPCGHVACRVCLRICLHYALRSVSSDTALELRCPDGSCESPLAVAPHVIAEARRLLMKAGAGAGADAASRKRRVETAVSMVQVAAAQSCPVAARLIGALAHL